MDLSLPIRIDEFIIKTKRVMYMRYIEIVQQLQCTYLSTDASTTITLDNQVRDHIITSIGGLSNFNKLKTLLNKSNQTTKETDSILSDTYLLMALAGWRSLNTSQSIECICCLRKVSLSFMLKDSSDLNPLSLHYSHCLFSDQSKKAYSVFNKIISC